jgi:hypothetical protein
MNDGPIRIKLRKEEFKTRKKREKDDKRDASLRR